MTPAAKGAAFRAIAVALAVSVAVVFHLVVDWSRPGPIEVGVRYVTESEIPGVPYLTTPGVEGWSSALGTVGTYEPAPEKPPGTFRIVVVSDSIAVSIESDPGEVDRTFPNVLHRTLRGSASSVDVEVLNMSTPGLSLRQYVAVIEHRVLGWDPDLVVVAFCFNDVVETPVREHDNIFAGTNENEFVGAYEDRDRWWDPRGEYVARLRSTLREVEALADRVDLVLVGVPRRDSGRRDAQVHLDGLAELTRDLDVEYVDLRAFTGPIEDAWFGRTRDDIHFTRQGHEAIARALRRAIAHHLPAELR